MRLYLDAAPLIYLAEQVVPYANEIRDRLGRPNTQCVSSELSRLECRIKPLRDDDQLLLADYDDIFAAGWLELLPISRAVLDAATALRARHRFLKTRDAIHLASAVLSACDLFVTNDKALEGFAGLRVEVMAG